jgi:hypothetical protein
MSVLSTIVTVGVAASALPSSPLSVRQQLMLRADEANTDVIYIGGSAVTADAASTGGLTLAAGQMMTLEVGDALVYGISPSASQILAVLERS